MIIWILSWIVLHMMWKDKAMTVQRALTVTLLLIAVGTIGTFPTRRRLADDPQLRWACIVLFTIAFLAAAIAGAFGAFITKAAPIY